MTCHGLYDLHDTQFDVAIGTSLIQHSLSLGEMSFLKNGEVGN